MENLSELTLDDLERKNKELEERAASSVAAAEEALKAVKRKGQESESEAQRIIHFATSKLNSTQVKEGVQEVLQEEPENKENQRKARTNYATPLKNYDNPKSQDTEIRYVSSSSSIPSASKSKVKAAHRSQGQSIIPKPKKVEVNDIRFPKNNHYNLF